MLLVALVTLPGLLPASTSLRPSVRPAAAAVALSAAAPPPPPDARRLLLFTGSAYRGKDDKVRRHGHALPHGPHGARQLCNAIHYTATQR